MAGRILAWVRFSFTLPWALLVWLLCILACCLQLAEFKKLRFIAPGVLASEWKPWLAKVYPYSLTLGRVIIFHPESAHDSQVVAHEGVHVSQVEDMMLLSLLLGLLTIVVTGDVLFGFALWASGGMWQIPNYFMAVLRHGHTLSWPASGSGFQRLKSFLSRLFLEIAYADSEHERSAYAQTDLDSDAKSWSSRRDESLNR